LGQVLGLALSPNPPIHDGALAPRHTISRPGFIGVPIGAFILGAFITDRVLAPLGIADGSPVALIIVAFIGAVILLGLLGLFAGHTVGARRWGGRRSPADGVNGPAFSAPAADGYGMRESTSGMTRPLAEGYRARN